MPKEIINIEIGAGNHSRKGFLNYDHRKHNYDMIFDELPLEDNTIDEVHMSHVLEHVPIIEVENVLQRIYKKIKIGGKIRIICPDLKELVKAYLRGDPEIFKSFCASTGKFEKYGAGGCFLHNIISFGNDTFLFDRTKKREIIGLAHCAAYDFEMLEIILSNVGFKDIIQSEYDPEKDYHKQQGQLFIEAYK